MDSKLVVEQMSRQLEDQAPRHEAAGAGGQPAGAVRHDVHLGAARAEQARRPARQRGARRQAQRASPSTGASTRSTSPTRLAVEELESPTRRRPGLGPAGGGRPTTLVLVRHGVTAAHRRQALLRRAGQQPTPGSATRAAPRSATVADWLAPLAEARRRGRRLAGTPHPRVRRDRRRAARPDRRGGAGLRRDGVRRLGRADLRRGRRAGPRRARRAGSARSTSPPPGGESFRRGARSGSWPGSSGCSTAHAGKTVVVVSHVTPIKTLVAHAVDAPLASVFRMELSPASVTVVSFFPVTGRHGLAAALQRPGPRAGAAARPPALVVRSIAARPEERPSADSVRWSVACVGRRTPVFRVAVGVRGQAQGSLRSRHRGRGVDHMARTGPDSTSHRCSRAAGRARQPSDQRGHGEERTSVGSLPCRQAHGTHARRRRSPTHGTTGRRCPSR